MKAFVRINAATHEVELQEVPVPTIYPDEVLIKVSAFGIGIHDRYFIPSDINFPYVIGSEGAGVIKEIGSQVTDFQVGDQVIITTILQEQGGCWAEYAVAKQAALIHLPKNLSAQEGASIPIAGKTALECMRELDLKSGDRLFIAGASGAIGTFIIQLAKEKGIHVSASASSRNQEYMQSLGAEHTVDYKNPDWKIKVIDWSNGGVDKALAIQPGTGIESIQVIKENGTLITVSGDHTSVSPQRNITVRQMGHQFFTNQELGVLINEIAQEKIKVVIEKEYAFEDALKALEKTETRRASGKVVVKIG